jgi:Concanavalin A-like lectin/glucanases superfamily
MADWTFIMTPLLVLLVLSLFRFVGCGIDAVGSAAPIVEQIDPEAYRVHILGHKELKAYWRLLDDGNAETVKDEKQFQDGKYITLETGNKSISQFITGQANIAPLGGPKTSRIFQGGFAKVDFKYGLYGLDFTLEAWVKPQWDGSGLIHTLFQIGGDFTKFGTPKMILQIYADIDNHWQVRLDNDHLFVSGNGPMVAISKPQHIALTASKNNGKSEFRLYMNGSPAPSSKSMPYVPPDETPLLIATADASRDSTAPVYNEPFFGQIQEVAIYNAALPDADILRHANFKG